MKPLKKPIVGNLCLLLGSSVLSLILLEVCYRFFLFGWSSLSIERMNSLHGIGVSGLIQASAYREIVFELKPNLRTYFKLTPFETNSHGLRDREYGLAKPPHTFRIAVVGDSFTMPSGVAIEDAFHTRLENRLNRESHGETFEVLNFGVSGHSLRHYVGMIEHRCSRYDPDLILVGFCARNDHQPPRWTFDKPFVPKPETHAFFTSFARQGFLLAKEFERKKERATRPRRLKRVDKRYLSKYLAKLGDFSREASVPVVVVLLDIAVVKSRFLKKKLSNNGIYFLNATLPFEGKKYADYVVNPLDSHPNGAANKIFADEIYAYLHAMKLVPGSQQRPTTPISESASRVGAP